MEESSSSSNKTKFGRRAGILVLLILVSVGGYMWLKPIGTEKESHVNSAPASQPIKVKINEPIQPPAVAPTASIPHDANNNALKQAAAGTKTAKASGKVDSKKNSKLVKESAKTVAAIVPAEEKPATKTMADKPLTQKKSPIKSARVVGKKRNKGGGHAIQVGSFLIKENAEYRLKELTKGGYSAYISEADVFSKHWYRVKIGPYQTKAAANKTATAIKARFKTDCFVISGKG